LDNRGNRFARLAYQNSTLQRARGP
jgi:hypothetical protein